MNVLQSFGIDWRSLIFYTINFSLLVVLLYIFAYKPVLQILAKRKNLIDTSLKNAEEIEKQKQQMQAEYKKVLQDATHESENIIAKATEQGQILAKKISDDAKKDAQDILEKAQEEIAHQREQTMYELKDHVGALLAQALTQTLGETLTDEERGRILQKSVDHISQDI